MDSDSVIPINRAYRIDTLENIGKISVKFYTSKTLSAIRWIYCWCCSPVQHVRVEIEGLLYEINHKDRGRWIPVDMLVNDPDYDLAIDVTLEVPKASINWDHIMAVSFDKKCSQLRMVAWGFLRGNNKLRDLPKPCPDCVSVAKDILGTMGILCSGELPWELYENLTTHYEHTEEKFRRFI